MDLFCIFACCFPPVLVQEVTIMCVFIRRDNTSNLFRTSNYQHRMWHFRKIIPLQIFLFCFVVNRELESRACSSSQTWKLFGERNCQASSSSTNNFPSMEADHIPLYKNKHLQLPLSLIFYLKWRWLFLDMFLFTRGACYFFFFFLLLYSLGNGLLQTVVRSDEWRKNSSNMFYYISVPSR